jgi:branched-chain amino acid transport system permease protein
MVFLVASLGIFTVIQALIAIIFSSQFLTLPRNIPSRTFDIFGGTITEGQIATLAATFLIMLILGFVLRRTFIGKSIRAVSDDEEIAQIVGVNSERIVGTVFFLGSTIGGIAGIAIGFDTGVQPTMGMSILLPGVIATIIGGVGNVYGSVLGAFLLAIVENIAGWYFPGAWREALSLLLFTLFLFLRPQGILQK